MTNPTHVFTKSEIDMSVMVTKQLLEGKLIDFPELIEKYKAEFNLREEMGKTLNLLLNLQDAMTRIAELEKTIVDVKNRTAGII